MLIVFLAPLFAVARHLRHCDGETVRIGVDRLDHCSCCVPCSYGDFHQYLAEDLETGDYRQEIADSE